MTEPAIDTGEILEALNDKADRDLNNTQPVADYVIETQLPTSSNNYSWYRLYKSGWVEQGGYYSVSSGGTADYTVNLLKNMADTNYLAMGNVVAQGTFFNACCTVKQTNSMTIRTTGYGSGTHSGFYWEAKGMSAQG